MLVGIVEFLGWFGAVTVLAGYILFSTGKIPNGPLYQLFNLVGGLAVAINVAAHHAVPSTIVNGIWAIVAVVVLVKMGRARRAAKRDGSVSTEPPVLHAEPAATTGVLPVIGPALRDHEPEDTAEADAATGLQSDDATDGTDATMPDAAPAAVPEAPAPMTETVPIITATIALALVAAAQEQSDRADRREHADDTGHAEPAR
ncbi:CBU_0592 family membrane protein [Curtobacterium flaccumfaciens]|uniref:CBU_0592 family membrane protein n=1 Tax=Curtobacterium flaccumfaciens TaxID=2035 RepID=UPI0039F69203